MTQTKEIYERRVAILRKLGAKIVELYCPRPCGQMFVDPKPLGGQKWALVTGSIANGRHHVNDRVAYCSERCASTALLKHRGPSAWIEGYEPPEKT